MEIIQLILTFGIFVGIGLCLFLLKKTKQCYYCENYFLPRETEVIGSYTYCLQHGYVRQVKYNQRSVNG